MTCSLDWISGADCVLSILQRDIIVVFLSSIFSEAFIDDNVWNSCFWLFK